MGLCFTLRTLLQGIPLRLLQVAVLGMLPTFDILEEASSVLSLFLSKCHSLTAFHGFEYMYFFTTMVIFSHVPCIYICFCLMCAWASNSRCGLTTRRDRVDTLQDPRLLVEREWKGWYHIGHCVNVQVSLNLTGHVSMILESPRLWTWEALVLAEANRLSCLESNGP